MQHAPMSDEHQLIHGSYNTLVDPTEADIPEQDAMSVDIDPAVVDIWRTENAMALPESSHLPAFEADYNE